MSPPEQKSPEEEIIVCSDSLDSQSMLSMCKKNEVFILNKLRKIIQRISEAYPNDASSIARKIVSLEKEWPLVFGIIRKIAEQDFISLAFARSEHLRLLGEVRAELYDIWEDVNALVLVAQKDQDQARYEQMKDCLNWINIFEKYLEGFDTTSKLKP